MSGELAVRESVPITEFEILKEKHDSLLREHEDLKKKQREAVLLVKGEIENWEMKYVELQKKLEKLEKDIKDLSTPLDDDDSRTKTPAEGVIEISSDDEGNQRESDGEHSNNFQNQEKFSFYL